MKEGKVMTEKHSIEKIVKAIEVDKMRQIVPDPNGRHPACIPGVGTGICEWCGKRVVNIEPCSAVPPEERWSIVWFDDQK